MCIVGYGVIFFSSQSIFFSFQSTYIYIICNIVLLRQCVLLVMVSFFFSLDLLSFIIYRSGWSLDIATLQKLLSYICKCIYM